MKTGPDQSIFAWERKVDDTALWVRHRLSSQLLVSESPQSIPVATSGGQCVAAGRPGVQWSRERLPRNEGQNLRYSLALTKWIVDRGATSTMG